MIQLSALLQKHNISHSQFRQSFNTAFNCAMSASSFSQLLGTGRLLKTIDNFDTKIAQHYNNLTGETQLKKNLLKHVEEKHMLNVTNLDREVLKHFNLPNDPFLPFITKESEIIMLPSHHYALDMMRASRDTGFFTIVTGEVGGGKSTVLGKFEAETNALNEYITIKVRSKDMERCNARDILMACVYDLSADKPKRNFETLTRQVEELLKKTHASGKRALLIVDEAQDLHTNTIKFLKRLWELRDGLTPLLGIVLIGQNELEHRLYRDNNLNLREVMQRTIHAPLEPINAELKNYINGKLKCVKGNIENVITADAIDHLASKLVITDRNGKKINKAYPLEINNRMKRLMSLAYDHGITIIDKNFINEVGA